MEKKIQKNISYILQVIDSARFMASSLSNLANNLSERIQGLKYKHEHDYKECETYGIKYKYCDYFLEYPNSGDDSTEYKCLYCNKSYQRKFDETLKEQFFNKCKFSKHDNNKFILFLQKGAYPYEYINDWENFNWTSLTEKEDFYSHLNMEDVTDTDYIHTKSFCKDFHKTI